MACVMLALPEVDPNLGASRDICEIFTVRNLKQVKLTSFSYIIDIKFDYYKTKQITVILNLM